MVNFKVGLQAREGMTRGCMVGLSVLALHFKAIWAVNNSIYVLAILTGWDI
mgnify:CR=1 FL=1